MAQAAPLDQKIAGEIPRAEPWAWGICWLMFASTTLCYMDRQAVSLVGTKIQGEFGIGDAGLGWIQAAFYLTYAIFQVPAGYLADRWDMRRSYAGAVAWWSLAGLATAFAPTVGWLMVLRGMLGVGESFNWPCALKATGAILPPEDRGLGNGIFNSGAAVGAVLTPLIVTPLADRFGWRTAFVVVGALGFVWVVVWLRTLARVQGKTWAFAVGGAKEATDGAELPEPIGTALPGSTKTALAALLVVSIAVAASAAWLGKPAIWWGIALLMLGLLAVARALPEGSLKGSRPLEDLGGIVRLRRFWVLVVVSISINMCWHFLVNWMAPYFQNAKGLGLAFLAGGLISAVPFVAADVGNIGGGWLSRKLARRGWEPGRARLATVGLATMLIAPAIAVGATKEARIVVPLLSVAALGVAAYMANYFAYCQEVSPKRTGLVVGYLGGLGNLFAAGFLVIVGWVSETTGGYGPAFVMIGLFPILGLLALTLGWGRGSEKPAEGLGSS